MNWLSLGFGTVLVLITKLSSMRNGQLCVEIRRKKW